MRGRRPTSTTYTSWGEHLGTVEAATEKEAVEKAAKQFDIPPERQNRIAVQKMSKSKD